MPEKKLEYLIHRIPDHLRLSFHRQLSESKRKRDALLAKMLDLIAEDSWDNARLYAALYPDKPYSDKQIRNLRSTLYRKLTDFLAWQEFASTPQKNLHLSQAMHRMGATKYLPALTKHIATEIDALPVSLEQLDLRAQLKFMSIKYQYASRGRKQFDLPDVIRESEEAFVARALYYALAQHNFAKIFPAESPPATASLLPGVLQLLEQGAYAGSVLIQAYFALYQMVRFPQNFAFFTRAKTYISDHDHLLGDQDAREMYVVIQNHCIQGLNAGELKFLAEIFDLNIALMQRGLLIDEHGLSPWRFKSIVTTAVRLHRLEWAQTFIEEQQANVPAPFRANAVHYGAGIIAFQKSNFALAESYMNTILQANEDPFFGMDARAWLLQIYYETENVTGMDSLSASFRLFLQRNHTLSLQRRKNYQEFVRFFRRLMALPPGATKRMRKLEAEIRNSPYQTSRQWLLEKLSQLLLHS